MVKETKEKAALRVLFKDFSSDYNSRNLSKKIGISHAGAFKILKKLEKNEIVVSKEIGKARIYKINKENPIAIKELELALLYEANIHKRWLEEFKQLKNNAKIVILFGSILRNAKEARDIDLLVVSKDNKRKEIKEIIENKNKILPRKIHLILQGENDFNADIKSRNKVMLEIIKSGIILYGQEGFVKSLKNEPR